MFRKMLSIFTVAVMLMVSVCSVGVFASDYVADIKLSQETGLDVAKPDDVKSGWNGGGYWQSGHNGEWWYIVEFDLSLYSAPLKKAVYNMTYREFSNDPTDVWVLPIADQELPELTYAQFAELAGEKIAGAPDLTYNFARGSEFGWDTNGLDITSYANDVIESESADKTLTLALMRQGENSLRIKSRMTKLTITRDVPEIATGSSAITKTTLEHGKITPDDSATEDVNEADSIYDLNSNGMYSLYNTDGSLPYGTDQAIFMKFEIPTDGEVESALMTLPMTSQSRTWTMLVYAVENDEWTHDTLTFNSVYSTTETTDVTVQLEGAEPVVATGVPAKGTYGPDSELYTTFTTISTEGNSATANAQFDVTKLVTSKYAEDGYITLAFMLYKNTKNSHTKYCNLKCGSAKIDYTLKATAAKPNDETFSFKVDGANANALRSGVLSAEVEVESDMFSTSQASLIMAVYQEGCLVGIYTGPTTPLNDRNTNGGKTTISVSTGTEVSVDANTTVKVFAWREGKIQQPLGASRVITSAGIQ